MLFSTKEYIIYPYLDLFLEMEFVAIVFFLEKVFQIISSSHLCL